MRVRVIKLMKDNLHRLCTPEQRAKADPSRHPAAHGYRAPDPVWTQNLAVIHAAKSASGPDGAEEDLVVGDWLPSDPSKTFESRRASAGPPPGLYRKTRLRYSRLLLAMVRGSGEKSKTSTETNPR